MNYLSGGVNSPIPIPKNFPNNIIAGEGPYVIDKNGQKYIDMWMGYGALLFGHADKEIIQTTSKCLKNGWFFSYQTKIEKDFSSVLHDLIPCAERVRFATTGSDAVAYAIRAARAYTSRDMVLSVVGGYHGVHEAMIASEGIAFKNKPDLVHFNNTKESIKAIKTKKYACMILEPIMANSGCTPPLPGYLQALRKACDETNTVLIFDEVVTGFRINLGGAQKKYGVTPDLSTFSKAIACGLPLSVVCGKVSILDKFIPTGNVFFAGTFNAHPLSLAVGTLVIEMLRDGKIHSRITKLGNRLRSFISNSINKYDLNACVQGTDSMLTVAFGCKDFVHGISNEKFNQKTYDIFVKKMAERKILFPPLPTETVFLSPVHEAVIEKIEKAFDEVFLEIKNL
ncbi:MAG: aminotransferase class III-fold pyridoxal phosphate-dependent enzyme [Candidatus Woesebacteria bacterium]|nr:aminotransferase class III-fold pyridoxal phosphate-dependent enzyme [Candidatus Woesebacteria bacterium]